MQLVKKATPCSHDLDTMGALVFEGFECLAASVLARLLAENSSAFKRLLDDAQNESLEIARGKRYWVLGVDEMAGWKWRSNGSMHSMPQWISGHANAHRRSYRTSLSGSKWGATATAPLCR